MIDELCNFSLREYIKDFKRPEKPTEYYYLTKIARLAMGQFKYKSDQVENLFLLEKYLWFDGKVMIWYSEVLGWVITRCMETGYNINGIAIKWKPVLDVQNSETIIPTPEMGIDDKCIVIYDIPSRIAVSSLCSLWCQEIADINETIKSQIFLQKTPIIAVCDSPKDVNFLKKSIVDIKNNIKVLFVGKDIRNDMKTLKMDAPFNISDLQAQLKTKEAEMLEYIGIDSQSSFQKKERLITSEQESNGQILTYLLNDRFESRKTALDELKKKGCTITIEKVMLADPNNPDTTEKENENLNEGEINEAS